MRCDERVDGARTSAARAPASAPDPPATAAPACAASSTVRFSDASSSTLVDADARRLPIVTVTVTDVSVMPPDVVMLASAKRVLPLHSLVMFTRVWSTPR